MADISGYTIDFNVYTGKANKSDHGLAHSVVMNLLEPYWFQGYEVFVDNFYTSPPVSKFIASWNSCTMCTTLRCPTCCSTVESINARNKSETWHRLLSSRERVTSCLRVLERYKHYYCQGFIQNFSLGGDMSQNFDII